MKYEFDPSKLEAAMQWERFPRAAKYDAVKVAELSMGPNVLWLAESLTKVMDLNPGMRVLDLGCGRALSSIFLAREFGLEVWAVDLWDTPTTNWELICEYGLQDKVIPLRGDGLALPFAAEYFDAVVSLDSYHYFGTGDDYPREHLFPLVKPEGQVGIVSPAVTGPLPSPLPDGLVSWVHEAHTVEWWREHWARNSDVHVEKAETLPGGRELWTRWNEAKLLEGMTSEELDLLNGPVGQSLGFVRMVARKHSEEDDA